MKRPLKIALITTDARHWFREFDQETPNFGTAIRALLEGFQDDPELEVHVISASPTYLRSRRQLASNIYFHHVHVAKWGWGRSLFLGVAWKIRKVIHEIRPDVVHGQGTERDCAVAAILSGLPNVLTIHGNMQELYRMGLQGHAVYGWLISLLESFALKRTDGVFCNSAYTRSLVSPRSCRHWLVPNPIRKAFFVAPFRSREFAKVPKFLNIGVISERKRQLDLLRMAGEIVRSGHPMHLVFVGDPGLGSGYGKAFAAELEVAAAAGYASMTGVLELHEIIRIMDESDGFIHFPSEEAFGLVVAEALARGLKFFGADLGGIRDIAAGISGAELYGDFNGLKEGVVRWLGSRVPISESAAEEVFARYHPKVIARRHLDIYREVLGLHY
jgi:glycosyltransferase involved in cell wall biosynthesis